MREKNPTTTLDPNEEEVPVEVTKSFENLAIEQLRATGYRITMPRIQVVRALASTKKAMSAYSIHEKILAGDGKIDVVSVYRILGTLQEVGLIHHIGIVDGYFPCRMDDAHQYDSEHFVCKKCGYVTEVPVDDDTRSTVHRQAESSEFLPTGIKIEAFGLCARCQAAAA